MPASGPPTAKQGIPEMGSQSTVGAASSPTVLVAVCPALCLATTASALLSAPLRSVPHCCPPRLVRVVFPR